MSKGKRIRAQRRVVPPPVGKKQPLDRRWWIGGAALLALVVVGVAVAAIRSSGQEAKPVQVDFAQLPGLQDGPPPWNNGAGELQDHLASLHLDPLAQEALAFHIHQHLDVYVNGKRVTVPPSIGILGSSFITELHTHQTDGVIHVESAQNRPYALGQFFGEWSVRLSGSCLGRYCGQLHWWLNGKPQTGNPADLVLKAHQEIVVAAGKPPTRIPSSYAFPAGE